jgi:hypothetical protein
MYDTNDGYNSNDYQGISDYSADEWDEDLWDDDLDFADPGGDSALRAESSSNPRDCDCPTCGARNVLTRADARNGYQCDACAARDEGLGW